MKLRVSLYLFLLFLLVVSLYPAKSFAATASCSDTWPVSSSCSGTVAWTSWTYNSGSNNCTRDKYRTGTKQTAWDVDWSVSGPTLDPTQYEGCLNTTNEFCTILPTPPSPPENNKSGSQYICDWEYTWSTGSNDVSAIYDNCQVWLDDDVTTRPTISKNSMSTSVYVGDTINDVVTASDPESGDVTSSITTSFNTGNYQRVSGQLSYKFTSPGTYTVYYDVNDPECGSPLVAVQRSRTFTVSPAPTYNWDWGSWGTCTGTQTRSVWCEQNGSQDGTQQNLVADSYCTANVGAKPATSQSCTVDPCQDGPYRWDTTAWSPTTCSPGVTQTRSYFCEDGNDSVADNQCCSGLTTPTTTNVCPSDPCSGLSSVCIGTANACSTYAQGDCNSTEAPGCSWTTSGSCTGSASACSTYGTSGACTSPAKGCSWSSSTGCTGTLSYTADNCNDWRRRQCPVYNSGDGWQSDCEYYQCKYQGAWCAWMCHWQDGNGTELTCENLCDYKVLPACSARANSTLCNLGAGCTWSTSYSCTGSVNACSTYSQSNCGSVSGCSWSDTSSCSGTATACSSRNQTQCNQTGSGCTWCEGTNTAPTISVASNESVCLSTTVNDITTASDTEDGDLTSSIVTNSPAGISKTSQLVYSFSSVGDKVMTYNVTDSGSLSATQQSRTVTVGYCGAWAYGTWSSCVAGEQTRTATCMLSGSPVADSYCDPNLKEATTQSCDSNPVITPQSNINTYVLTWINDSSTATDNEDGNITSDITTNSLAGMTKDPTNDLRYYFTADGTYVVTYDVVDSSGNAATQKSSTVTVGYQAAWDSTPWGVCDPDTDTRSRTAWCELPATQNGTQENVVADGYCDPDSKPDTSGACVTAAFECSTDNIHWNDCSETLFMASPRSKLRVRQNEPIAATSWNWTIPTDTIANTGPVMRVADQESATAQTTSFDFTGEVLSPEIQRKIRLDIGAAGDGGVAEKTVTIKFVNPQIEEA